MEQKRQIINIVNFIRGYDSEPQPPMETYDTVKHQIELMEKYQFKGTFLIQYDTLEMPHFRDLMLSLDKSRYEIGVWFEVIQPLAEACGVEWKCEREWSGLCNCGYSMAYDPKTREKMVDLVFEQFKSIFGYYPRVFGAWFYDTYTIRYINDKYGLDALCNCKEQYGTDGYTLWGGYYGQAYYPSRTNVFLPAQSEEEQMNVPLFRMLGSDQVYQYDYTTEADLSPAKAQSVITLEPVYHDAGGGLPQWVDWYLKENFNGECLSFGYAQAGQENSFGWQRMKDGLIYQFRLFDALQKQGKITIEQLGESGRWYKENYASTPASAITAHSAYDDENKDSAWYCSKYFRLNLYGEDGQFRIRDCHLFDESIEDPFEHTVCKETFAVYESLPLVDGYLFSGNGVRSGAYFTDYNSGKTIHYSEMRFAETKENECKITFVSDENELTFHMSEKGVTVTGKSDFALENRIGRKTEFLPAVSAYDSQRLTLTYKGKTYSVTLSAGRFENERKIVSENGIISAVFQV